MPTLKIEKHFMRQSSRITKNSKAIHEKLLKILKTLQENPFTPALKTHKLSGNLKDRYSCFVTDDIRITFKLSDDNIYLLNIGSHDDVY
ncbi:MAG: type II toxin-antitoxin system mRNA interferase toxin, RelE/StbE family [Nitrospirae bacterium]|nr:type II toxin-antitoxin system mRNA interferase toxin, RelE/StbE family [Nitrospirota bacterium]MBF0533722.1 type II toxin-antitoxin system mRNA interferase toxin, RelE/StbE family [Nitrospirota bacterium]MBF0615569.1 type II toxin-antitoxin system mRNA interferase toxin, RelE/StbE family [Nitrospirota bacterium]